MTDTVVLTAEMAIVLFLLAVTVYLFAFSVVRVDVAAMIIMVTLGLVSQMPGIEPILDLTELFSGFSSNAVISIIAVMIIGRGLDKTGLMGKLAQLILNIGGKTENRISPLLSGIAALASSFMQNIGVAALFLPVVSRVSSRTGIPMSRLLMPVGFCIILGGTATMIGSSPLILLNDLLLSSNRQLPSELKMAPFGLFSVLPIGIALSITGVLYFVVAGRFVLPKIDPDASRTSRTDDYFQSLYGISGELLEAQVTVDSPMVGMSIHQIEDTYENTPFMLALYSGDVVKIPPDREETVWVNTRLGLLGDPDRVAAFCKEYHWTLHGEPDRFAKVLNQQYSGIGEIVIPPASTLVGKAIGEIKPRRNFGTN
ncbi:MAG: SLC13 family permease, partial [Granulosicoccus sp.]|nr:SLC13 family permease [Granulosicoccus sp.]